MNSSLKMTFRPVPIAPVPPSIGTGSPKSIDDVAEALKMKFGANVVKAVEKAHKGNPFVTVDAEKIADVLQFLRDDERFLCTALLTISATDFLPKKGTPATETVPATPDQPGRIELAYFVFSYTHRHQIFVKAHVDRDQPKLPTTSDVYRAANWYERECFDMLGVVFTGHPCLERVLLPSDWVGYPLRRDYVFPEEYNGMKVPL